MNSYPITCPRCGHRCLLKVANPQTLVGKEFKCPKCQAATPFVSLVSIPQQRPAANPSPITLNDLHTNIGGSAINGNLSPITNNNLHTHIGGPAINVGGNEKTRVINHGMPQGPQMPKRSARPRLTVVSTGVTFDLPVGTFVLGRASSDSTATIKLAPDKYMSRQHANINVTESAGRYVCQLLSRDSINRVFVNDYDLAPGESVTLKDGDTILLGVTKVRYNYKP